jgi:predicted glycogen debranching enzyme
MIQTQPPSTFEELIDREWLAVNHLGGYASSTPIGLNTRKYHGLLVASMLPPVRRMVILSRVEETVFRDGWPYALSCNEYPDTIHPEGHRLLKAFDADPYPRWAYQGDGWTLQKELRLLRSHNTVCLTYTLLASDKPIELELRPLFALRIIHELMYQWNGQLDAQPAGKNQYHIPPPSHTPEVFFAHEGEFDPQGHWYLNTIYRREQERGYGGLEDLWMPGTARWTIQPGQSVHFVCSTEPIDLPRVLDKLDQQYTATPTPPGVSHNTELDGLIRAADQFVAFGRDHSATLMSGYPWASISVRESLISFTGLLLVNGRLNEARTLLQTLSGQLHNGLLPSCFPIAAGPLRYESADASLWYIHAAYQYLRYGGDESFVLRTLWPALEQIIESYLAGTDLDIRIADNGLLSSHQPGIPTTWMNARVGDWVVTPRYGQPVELNALWHNALCITSELATRLGQTSMAERLSDHAKHLYEAFNAQFWNESAGCCFDVIDQQSRDGSIRPNQLLAMSLPFAILDPARHESALRKITDELLTPFGLRSLSPRDQAYQGRYGGDLLSRDRAYHQGSVYPWLLGPYITATLRLNGRSPSARKQAGKLLEPLLTSMPDRFGLIPELFDGDAPHRPGGLVASAISTAELLRTWTEEILDLNPDHPSFNSTRRTPVATIILQNIPNAP